MTGHSVEPDQVLALDNQVCFALYAANRAVTARYRPLLAELGITYPQYLVLLVMWEADRHQSPVRVSYLGQRLRLDSGTLTPLLKRLEGQGLILRKRDPSDERAVLIELTEPGRTLRERAAGVPGQLLCNTGIDPQQLASLRDELKNLLAQMDAATSDE